MGKRSRRRVSGGPKAPETEYTDSEGSVLLLRGVLGTGSRRELAAARGAGVSREDAEQRTFELLFERLAVSWTVAGVPTSGQRELLGRLRMATPAERQWVRDTLRTHCAEWFPDVAVT